MYVGSTKGFDVRKKFHKKTRRPTPLRASDAKDIVYKELETGLPTLETALASEALFAARLVAAEPQTAHGGPWSQKKLTAEQLQEAQTVARFRSYSSLFAYANANPGGRVDRHLRNLRYVTPEETETEAARGGFVVKYKRSGRSGSTGVHRRRIAVLENPSYKNTEEYEKAHRGREPKRRRAQETVNARMRRQSLRRQEKESCV